MEKGKTERGKSEGGGFRDRFCNYICQSTPSHSDRQRSRFPSLPCCHQIKRKTENKVEDGGVGGEGAGPMFVCLSNLTTHTLVPINMCQWFDQLRGWWSCATTSQCYCVYKHGFVQLSSRLRFTKIFNEIDRMAPIDRPLNTHVVSLLKPIFLRFVTVNRRGS